MEEWKDIKGYEGLYQVSTLGRVRSLPRKYSPRERYLRPGIGTNGYLRVVLSKNGIVCDKDIHRLVAQAFIPNPDNMPFVNHKDEVKIHNQVENLEWCTPKYNVNYGGCLQRISESRKGQRLSAETIDKIRSKNMKKVMCIETGKVFDSIKSAEAATNATTICNALKGRIKTAGGYHWRYV